MAVFGDYGMNSGGGSSMGAGSYMGMRPFEQNPNSFDYKDVVGNYGRGGILDHSSNTPSHYYGTTNSQPLPTDYDAKSPFGSGEIDDGEGFGTRAKNFLFGTTNEETGVRTRGGLLPILNTFTGLASAYLGMKQYGLAKDSFRQNRKEFGYNYDAQRQLTNARMRGQAAARYSSNPGHYQTPTEYMAQNEIAERTG